jgi:hypothetical protein
MNTSKSLLLMLAVFLAACSSPQHTKPDSAAAPEEPLEVTLAKLDEGMGDAFAKKDTAYFEQVLDDNYVGQTSNGPVDKATMIKIVESVPCKISSMKNSDGRVTKHSDFAAIRTSKETMDGECGGVKLPDAYNATLFVKEADLWKVAYHQSLYIPKDTPAGEAAKPIESKKAGNEEAHAGSAPRIRNDPEIAEELGELEKEMLAAWAKKDLKFFEKYLSDDYAEINPRGAVGKDWLLKDVAGHNCKVSHDVSDLKATKAGDGIVILTYEVKESGTCEGKPLFYEMPIYTASIWRIGDRGWKFVFHMTTPAG